MEKRVTKFIMMALILIAGAFLAGIASANQMGMGHGRGMMDDGKIEGMHQGYPMWGHLKDLGLDEKQKADIKEIREKVVKETIRKKADERIARIELRDLLVRDSVDMPAVQAKLKQIEALKTDIRLAHIEAREQIKAKLTPEQRKKFIELRES